MMLVDLEPYRAAVTDHVCRPCEDKMEDGRCIHPVRQPCAVAGHLPLVVSAILEVGPGAPLADYRAALGARACPICPKDESGFCSLLEMVDDSPETHLWRIVNTVLDVAARQGEAAEPPVG